MKPKGKRVLALTAAVALTGISCRRDPLQDIGLMRRLLQPAKPFAEYTPPPAPDYADPAAWGCLPDRPGDPCDQVPENSGLSDHQATAAADCFLVYPTTFYRDYGWNARLDDGVTKWITDRGPLRTQFSVYNESCRIFSPYYRQAGLAVFFQRPGDPSQQGALDLASADVIAAFEYYLAHYDRGNPIIIGGHSQGIRHAIRVLQKYFDGQKLQPRLVAGYLIGGNLHEETFSLLPVCNSPTSTGCVLGWRTVALGARTNDLGEMCKDCEKSAFRWVCVNPLSWRADREWVDASANLGGVPFGFDKIEPAVTGAQCTDGGLGVKPAITRGYPALGKTNYHLCDYSFFYLNIRANLKERTAAFGRRPPQ